MSEQYEIMVLEREVDKLKEENEFLKLSLKVSRRNNEELSMHNYYDVYRKMINFIKGLHSKDLYYHNDMTPEVMSLLNYIEDKFEELLKSCENEQ